VRCSRVRLIAYLPITPYFLLFFFLFPPFRLVTLLVKVARLPALHPRDHFTDLDKQVSSILDLWVCVLALAIQEPTSNPSAHWLNKESADMQASITADGDKARKTQGNYGDDCHAWAFQNANSKTRARKIFCDLFA
jgi:hypothetical protein